MTHRWHGIYTVIKHHFHTAEELPGWVPTRVTTHSTHLLRKSVYSACRMRPVRIIMVWKHWRSMAHSLQSVAAATHTTCIKNKCNMLLCSACLNGNQSNTHPWWWPSACSCTGWLAHQTPCQVPRCWGTCSPATPPHGPLQQQATHYITGR